MEDGAMLRSIDKVRDISKKVNTKQLDISQRHSVLKKEIQHDIRQGKKSLSDKSDSFNQKYSRYF